MYDFNKDHGKNLGIWKKGVFFDKTSRLIDLTDLSSCFKELFIYMFEMSCLVFNERLLPSGLIRKYTNLIDHIYIY